MNLVYAVPKANVVIQAYPAYQDTPVICVSNIPLEKRVIVVRWK